MTVKDPVEGLRDIFRQGQPRRAKGEKKGNNKNHRIEVFLKREEHRSRTRKGHKTSFSSSGASSLQNKNKTKYSVALLNQNPVGDLKKAGRP